MAGDVTRLPWICRKQVLPQHTDHAGVLWHGSYVAWLEEARVQALAEAGLAYAELSAHGLELMVVDLQLRYLKALHHGEVVELHSWLQPQSGVRLPFLTRFIKADGALAAEALVTLALVDRQRGRLQRQPPSMLASALECLAAGPATSAKHP
ncbi:MAG: thioesterase [Synechococcus sp. TMED169]|nr:MAG: thioesterase [Synechococcus sp. TMED169]